jgi:hypothetical protein
MESQSTFDRRLADHEPLQLDIKEVVRELVDVLGRRTVAYLAGLNSVREVASWLSAETKPHRDRDAVLRSALQATRYIVGLEGRDSAAAWFVGTNPRFDFESPAATLRKRGSEGCTEVVRAAVAFVSEALSAASREREQAQEFELA